MKRSHILLAGLGLSIVLLSVAQIAVSNSLTTGGIQLSLMQHQIATIQRENTILEEKIYSLSSLTTISAAAQKMGFVDANETAVVITTDPLASAPLAIKP